MAIELSFFGLHIKSYTFFLMLAFIIASLALKYNIKKLDGKNYEYLILTILGLTVGIFGAHFFATFERILYNVNVLNNIIFSKTILSHGKNFLGGIILFLPCLFIYSKISKLNFTQLLCVCCLSLCIGYSIGRIGCLISGDGCYGIPTDLPWGMSFEHGLFPTKNTVHPTPLYESILTMILFIHLQIYYIKSKDVYKHETIVYKFFILFGFQRFLVEFIRLNNIYFIFTQAQWISILMIIIGFIYYIKIRKKKYSNQLSLINQ